MSAIQLLVTLAVATACGMAAQRFSLPGGIILGSMVGAGAVTLISDASIVVPRSLQSAAFVVIGASVGVLLTREAVVRLPPIVVPSLLSAVLLIAAGIAVAYGLRLMGIAPPGDVLATSPGALTVVGAMAVEQGVGVIEVALFHLVRIVTVILTLPLVAHLLRSPPA